MAKPIQIESLERPRVILVIVFVVVAINYFIWRLGSFNEEALSFSLLIYVAEMFGLMTTALHLFMTWKLPIRPVPSLLEGRSVDVFIPTINEPVDLVRRTLVSAKNMRYPCRIWLLDDGRRKDMEALALELGVEYLARSNNIHAKAGNLNYALDHSDGEFVAIFDCDHAPHYNFISHTIGYFVDEQVALVQTPQDFFNLDSFQHRKSNKNNHIWTEQSLFFRVIQRGKDYWNASFFCGSCAIVRRTAIDSIGGFATGTVTEDLHTSIKIHEQGYRTIYHPETLAYGLAPSTLRPFLLQRQRWGQGAMHIWKKEGILFNRRLTIPQRLNYFASMVTYFDGWQKGIFYFSPVFVLLTGIMPIAAINSEFLIHFIPYILLTFWVFEEAGRGYGHSLFIEQYNMARFFTFAQSTLSLLISPKHFKVTPKTRSESAVNLRTMTPQLLVAGFNILVIPLGILLFISINHLNTEGLIANLIWATVNGLLGVALLRFIFKHQRFARHDYRFPIPLPIRITSEEGEACYAIVDNISATGCRIYGRVFEAIDQNGEFEGELFLPTGKMSVRGKIANSIRNETAQGMRVVAHGVEFLYSDPKQQNDIDRFLFGSSLQNHLNDLTEKGRTPLGHFIADSNGHIHNRIKDDRVWSAALISMVDDKPTEMVAMIVENGRYAFAREILTSHVLAEHSLIKAVLFRRSGAFPLHMKIIRKKLLDSPAGPLYLYTAVAHEETGAEAGKGVVDDK